jgi:VWFA-related protein
MATMSNPQMRLIGTLLLTMALASPDGAAREPGTQTAPESERPQVREAERRETPGDQDPRDQETFPQNASPGVPPAGDILPLYVEEEVEARLVLVPVTVTDRGRRPVLDLDVSEFILRVDRQPYPIATFDPPLPGAVEPGVTDRTVDTDVDADVDADSAASAEETAAAADPDQVTTVAIVIDMYQTRPGRVLMAIRDAEKMLEKGVPSGTRVGLFVISNGTLVRLTPFTTDIGYVAEEVRAIPGSSLSIDSWVTDEASRQRDVLVNNPTPEAMETAVSRHSRVQAMRVRHVLESLQYLAAAMSRIPGRKSVIFVSDGIREQAGINYALGAAELAPYTVNMSGEFRSTTSIFGQGGVTLSPVCLLGVYMPKERDRDGLDELFGSLESLAKRTGGRRPTSLNDFAGEITQAVERVREIYLLGFRPQPDEFSGTVHRIDVRVRRPKLVVSARSQYVEGYTGVHDEALLGSAASLPEYFRDFPLQASLRQLPAPDGARELQVQVELRPGALAWTLGEQGKRAASIRISGVLRLDSGGAMEAFHSRYRLRAHPSRPPRSLILQQSSEQTAEDLKDIVIVIEDQTARRFGTAVLSLRETGEPSEPVRISAPILLTPHRNIYLLTPTRQPLLGLSQAGRLYLPGDPVFGSQEPFLAVARVVGLPDAGQVRFCLEAEQVNCLEARLHPERPAVDESSPPQSFSAWISLAPDVLPVIDTLRVEALDATGATVASQPFSDESTS